MQWQAFEGSKNFDLHKRTVALLTEVLVIRIPISFDEALLVAHKIW